MASEEEVVRKNKGLVFELARKYSSMADIEDIIQEGYIGLVDASRSFDPDKGKFSSWAVIHIKKRILRYITNNFSTIRVPSYVVEIMGKENKGLDPERKDLLQLGAKARRKKVYDELGLRQNERLYTVLLPVYDNSGIENKEYVAHLLGCLDQRNRDIVESHFGIGKDGLSQWEIGRRQGVSRSAIFLRLHAALRRMRRFAETKKVRKVSKLTKSREGEHIGV